MARHWVGTSGWSYASWKGLFYPRGLKQGDWLRHYAAHLGAVELNATFYRPPRADVVQGWHDKTPGEFLFAVKAWRAVTHFNRLSDGAGRLDTFFERIAALGEKAGPVLFQLPPRFPADVARLGDFLALLPAGRRYAFEFRDASWHADAIYDVLAQANAAFVPFELGRQRGPRIATADFVYVRLHGRKARYKGNYGKNALTDWATWLGEMMDAGRDAYVFFDNTDEADYAIRNAVDLAAMLDARGS